MRTAAGFPTDAFAGTAEDYVRYRLPYPRTLLDDLLARAAPPPGGRLLDLGCGPGRLALDLAHAFAEVWAVDIEPEMIAAGKAEAQRRGIDNVRWLVRAAEELAAPAGHFHLIVAGEAFHRFDQAQVIAAAWDWLKPGGCLADAGGEGPTSGAAPWQLAAQAVVRRYSDRPSPGPVTPLDAIAMVEASLRAAGFAGVASYDFHLEHVWSAAAIIGHLRSTSYASRALMGDRADAFAAEMRAALLACEPSDRFPHTARFGYTLGRKPA